jgi:hypothetical protein
MKRTFFLLIAFTLVVFGASAQVQIRIGGLVETNAVLMKGLIEENSDFNPLSSTSWAFALKASVMHRDGTIGGKGAFTSGGTWAYIWWKPVDFFYLKLGNIFEDSTWACADVVGWGLHANDFSIVRPLYGDNYGFAGNVLPDEIGFYPGFKSGSVPRLQASLYPFNNFSLNIGLQMMRTSQENAAYDFWQNYVDLLNVQLVYKIDDAGEAAVSFANAPQEAILVSPLITIDSIKNIYVQWKMPIGNNMRIEAGVNYGIAGKDVEGNQQKYPPVKIGLGWGMGSFNVDTIAITTRIGAFIPVDNDDDFKTGLDLVFSADLQIFRLYIPIGVSFLPGDEFLIGWCVNPYIVKNLRGPYFYGGFQIYNGITEYDPVSGKTSRTSLNIKNKDTIDLAVSIGLRWEF